jgi:hypothetical protein
VFSIAKKSPAMPGFFSVAYRAAVWISDGENIG